MLQDPDADPVDDLRDIPREVAPPADLEERTISALRSRALLRERRVPWVLRPSGWLAAAVIVLAAFFAGMGTGRMRAPAPRPEPSFALMLYGEIGGDSATQMERAAEYGRWARAAHTGARVLGGEALGGHVVDVGRAPIAGGDELVGFFLIQASDRQAAARMAAECPHVKYGGRVVVREIQPT
ncbi:MAG: hypothetical protein AB1762_04675 [Gemmatimonadota bacterium]